MGEVKLLLKEQSEQAKKKILADGHVDPSHAEAYKESLIAFDSVDISEYEKA